MAGGAAGSGRSVAWEDPGVGFPVDAWTTWRESLLEPAAFFRRLDPAGSLARAVLYLLLVTVLGAFFHLLWQAYLYVPMMGDAAPYAGGFHVVQFFTAPFFVLLGLGLQTLVLHLFVLMLAPERRGVGATARIVCYAAGPAVLVVIPFVGGLVAWVWSVGLQVIGIREVHRTSTGRAVVVALSPLLLGLAAGLSLGLLVALTAGGWS